MVIVVVTFSGILFLPTNAANAFFQLPIFTLPVAGAVIQSGITAEIKALWESFIVFLSAAFLTIGSWILWAGGTILDKVLSYTIVEMSANVKGNLSTAISAAWTAFRDLANILFIFILLYIAIGTILGLSNVNTKKLLTRVIIVALLLNFSLFFTKLIIDASNITSTAFYNAILNESPRNAENQSGGLSGAIAGKFGVVSIYETENLEATIRAQGTLTRMFMYGIFGALFMVFASFVLFAIAFLFIARFVIIIFLFILSPLAFAALALPKDEYSGRWWKSLWDQAIFAPACLALLWVVVIILDAIIPGHGTELGKTIAGEAGKGQALGITAPVDAGQIFMNFALVAAFTIGSLIVAKEAGAYGAGGMMKLGSKLRVGAQGVLGGATLGAGAALGRGTFGRFGRAVAESDMLKRSQARGGILGRTAGLIRRGGEKTAESSFDVRATAAGKEAFGTFGGLGKAGGKGGYNKTVEEREKAGKKLAESLEPDKVMIRRTEQRLERAQQEIGRAESSGDTATAIKRREDVVRLRADLDRMKGVSAEEAQKRFESTGEKRRVADLAKSRFAGIPDSASKQAEVERFMKEKEAEYIEATKHDSEAKQRAMSYAEELEKRWLTINRYSNRAKAVAIRKEASKNKDDKRWDKLLSKFDKKDREGLEKPEGEEKSI